MKGTTGLTIRFNQLVVGGFVIKDVSVARENPDGTKAMITKPRYYFGGDMHDHGVDTEVTLMYNLEPDQLRYFHPHDFLGVNEPRRIPNQEHVQIDRQELRKKIQDFSKPWYHHSSGAVSRKPLFPGQEPAKNVVVVKMPDRLNHGLTPEEVARFNPLSGQNIAGKSNMVGKLWGELRAFADKHQFRAIVNGNVY